MRERTSVPRCIGGDFEGAAGGKACSCRWVQDASGRRDREFSGVFLQKKKKNKRKKEKERKRKKKPFLFLLMLLLY